MEEFRKVNTEVIACSVDSAFTHLAWVNQSRAQGGLAGVQIPLLSDLTHQISKVTQSMKTFGVQNCPGHFRRRSRETYRTVVILKLQDYGVYLEDLGHSLRGLFIIDGTGILRQITMNDLPVGRSVDETLRLIQAFQFTDKHGEVCPAGWKPGKDTV